MVCIRLYGVLVSLRVAGSNSISQKKIVVRARGGEGGRRVTHEVVLHDELSGFKIAVGRYGA